MKRKQSARTKALLPRATIIAGAMASITLSSLLVMVLSSLGVGGSHTSQLPQDRAARPTPQYWFSAPRFPDYELLQRWVQLREIVEEGEEALNGSSSDPNTGANRATDTESSGGEDGGKGIYSRGWIFDYVIEQEQARVRADLAARIDRLLTSRGSPLAGLGKDFVWAQERTGVSATLMVGLTAAESTYGTDGYLCTQNHNCFGMKWNERIQAQNVGGWCWWPDYGSSIQGAADFIIAWWGQAQTAYDLMGYCEGNPSDWFQTVEAVRRSI